MRVERGNVTETRDRKRGRKWERCGGQIGVWGGGGGGERERKRETHVVLSAAQDVELFREHLVDAHEDVL
jgi:hypothetical protein